MKWCAIIFYLASCGFCLGDAIPKVLPEAKQDFGWFNRLGFADVNGKAFVQIKAGDFRNWEGKWVSQYVRGFLLSTNGDAFSILTADLSEQHWTNSPIGTSLEPRLGFSTLELKDEAKACVNRLRSTPEMSHDRRMLWQHLPFVEVPLLDYVEAFVLGWACWRQGFEDEADQLYRESRTASQQHARRREMDYRTLLENDLGELFLWRTIVDFQNPQVTRSELLSRLKTIRKNYPRYEQTDRERAMPAVLEKMIAEDDARSGPQMSILFLWRNGFAASFSN